MRITTNKLDFLIDVLEDFCDLHSIKVASADDILYGSYRDKLTTYQISWLEHYIQVWDQIEQGEV